MIMKKDQISLFHFCQWQTIQVVFFGVLSVAMSLLPLLSSARLLHVLHQALERNCYVDTVMLILHISYVDTDAVLLVHTIYKHT